MNIFVLAPFLLASALPASQWPLVAAIIEHESAWQPNATSPANARGIMQLTPIGVKEAIKECPKAAGYRLNLYNPATSVWLGTCLLKRLARIYNYDTEELLAHYNGGGRAVAALRAGEGLNKETQRYIKNVLATAEKYGWKKQEQQLVWEEPIDGL